MLSKEVYNHFIKILKEENIDGGLVILLIIIYVPIVFMFDIFLSPFNLIAWWIRRK